MARMITNRDTKRLIRASRTFEQADNVLSNTWCRTDCDKMEYLRQLFPEELGEVGISGEPQEDYKMLVMAVIHSEDNQPYMWGYKDGHRRGREDGYEEAVLHLVKEWNELRKLSQEGIREYFKRILHQSIEDIV